MPVAGNAAPGLPRRGWLVLAAPDADLAAAVAAGARAAVVACADDFRPLGRLDAALAVAEAEAGVAHGSTGLIAVVAGAGAAACLPWRRPPSPRLLAIGLAPATLAADAGDDPAVATAAGLVALAARAAGLGAFLLLPAAAPMPCRGFARVDWRLPAAGRAAESLRHR